MMDAAKYCEDKTRGAGSSFFYAFLFLPEDQRRAMMALYAFCREVDDIADRVSERDVALRKLDFWREEIHLAYAHKARHPVGKELSWANARFNLPEELFHEILDGMTMDVMQTPICSPAMLELYCYRVAGVVGLLSIDVFGYRNRQSRRFAIALGNALQLTNILRDLAVDARMGRFYLPEEERVQYGVSEQDLRDGVLHAGLQALLNRYGAMAQERYEEALRLLPEEDRPNLRPCLVMGAIYHAHLTRLQRVGFDVWQKPVQLAPLHKMWIAWRTWSQEKKAQRKGLAPQLFSTAR